MVITQVMAGVSPVWLLTVPLPTPEVALEIRMVNGPFRNSAESEREMVILRTQAPVPLHGRAHPPKAWPLAGLALRVTVTPEVYRALQPVLAAAPPVMVQVIPAGLEVTTPFPVPVPDTVSRY